MKQNLKTAFFFNGLFLGAGFVSGQELWQFFGCFGGWGLVGLVLTAVLFAAFGILLVRMEQVSGILDMGEVVVPWKIPWLQGLVGAMQMVCLFGLVAIMLAGGEALVHQLIPAIPAWLAGVVMCGLVLLVSLRGLEGLTAVFSVFVPIMIVATICFAVASVFLFGTSEFTLKPVGTDNPLLPNFAIAAVTYAGSNYFGVIGLLTMYGPEIPTKKQAYTGILMGTVLLCAIACSILGPELLHPASTLTAMPMLDIACALCLPLGSAYGVLLFLGMFGTALSGCISLCHYVQLHWAAAARHPRLTAAVPVVGGYFASLVGFGNLIGMVYPVFGYFGILFMALIWVHFRKCRKAPAHPELL